LITSQLKQKMRKRDFLKKKAKQTGDPLIWQQYKHSQNSTNNEIKIAKSQYFKVNLEAKGLFKRMKHCPTLLDQQCWTIVGRLLVNVFKRMQQLANNF
jgi:hypothetical protein